MSSYKTVTNTSTMTALVADGFSLLQELAEECREIVDNASEGLSQTQRIQTLGETAVTFERLSEVDVPECCGEVDVSYQEAQPKRRRASPSRAVRRDNACSMLRAAADAMQEWLDANEGHDKVDDVEQAKQEIEDACDEAEGCEFPGMFG